MKDKVQKIREEVKTVLNRRLNLLNGDNFDLNKEVGGFTNEIMDIIDSMQEEPVSEDLEKAAWLYYDKNRLPIPPDWDLHKEFIDFFKAGVRWKEQNDSTLYKVLERDNLDEMAEEYSSCTYLEEVLGEGDREVLKTRLKNTFKAGAKWQKERIIIKVCKWFNDNACNYFGHMPVYPFIDDLRKAMED